jgi:hypothetical protein
MVTPRYSVVVTLNIGEYKGQWTGNEEKMTEKRTVLCLSPSKNYAELLYKSLTVGRSLVFQEPIENERP